jgi:hypothetical protein
MRELFILIAHLLVTLAKLGTRGGLGAVAAESLAVKHQLLIMKRAQRRAPKLTSWDRLVLGVCALFVSPRRLGKMAVILKTSTLLRLHHALVKRKYLIITIDVGPRPAGFAGYQTGRWNFGARIEALKPAGEDTHHAEPSRPGVAVCRTVELLPAQEQIDRDVISTFAVGELGKAAQDPFGEGQVVAEAASDGDVVLEADG